jgi:CRP/FNR family transcriptional regulator, cyclic AMP receptor protein
MANEELLGQLRKVDLFADLSDKDLKVVADRGSVIDHAAGAVLTEQDKSGVGFHLILSGSADVEVRGEPRGSMGPGAYFGEVALIDGEPRSATVRVGGDGAQTFSLTAWSFKPLLTEYPEIPLALLKVLCARLRKAEAALDAG